MTKAMNYCIGLSIALLTTQTLSAQDYKTQVTNSKETQLVIKDFGGDLPIEGYSGSEIVISGGPDLTLPDRAKGLKPVYSGGTDNTGIGVSVEKSANKITIICLLPFNKRGDYRIKVPDNLALKISSGCEYNNSVEISNMKNEIDINICYNIKIKNSTGPLVLSTINGGVDVVFSEISKDKPTSIASINGEIDVTMPANSAVNLEMRNMQGGMYTDFDLPADDKQMRRVGGGAINAKINGGGVSLKMNNINGNIYLRKK
jgi:lia operon protein LiaG